MSEQLSQEQYIRSRIALARGHLEAVDSDMSQMPDMWTQNFYELALKIAEAASETISALVNTIDLAAKEDEYVIERLASEGHDDLAGLAEMVLSAVTGRCSDPNCATQHDHGGKF